MPGARIGAMRERLTIQSSTPVAKTISGLVRSGTTATATTTAAHGFVTGDFVTVAGATPSGYNGRFKVTVPSTTTFTYTVSAALATPATGSITGVYYADAQGGRRETWTVADTVWAEMVPIGARERIAAMAIEAQTDYRFRIRSRVDVTPKMQALWTPGWPAGASQKTLEIHGVLPDGDGRTYQLLECGEA